MTEVSIEQPSGTQHGAQHRQQPIGHAAQRPSVRMAASPQPTVVLAADGVVRHAHPRPMIGGVAQPRIATVAHLHAAMLAALPREWRDSGIGAQRVVVFFREGLRSKRARSVNTAIRVTAMPNVLSCVRTNFNVIRCFPGDNGKII